MILRAIRYSCGLNFSIEAAAMKAIKNNIFRLKECAPEALRRELNALLLADKEFGCGPEQLASALKMCKDLGALK